MTPTPTLSTAVADLDLPKGRNVMQLADEFGTGAIAYTAQQVREAQRAAVIAALARSAAPAPAEICGLRAQLALAVQQRNQTLDELATVHSQMDHRLSANVAADEVRIRELMRTHRTYNQFDTDEWPVRFAKAVWLEAIAAALAAPASDIAAAPEQQFVLLSDTTEGTHPYYGDGRFFTMDCVRSAKALSAPGSATAGAATPTYSSTQATNCAGCGQHRHTPLRVDAMGGYLCLTCIDHKLGSLLGEFGYAAEVSPPDVAMPGPHERELARAATSPVPIKDSELAAFHRFCDCCEDFDAGGHDVDKAMMSQLVRIGLVRPAGPGRHETTKFGDWLRDTAAQPAEAVDVAMPEPTDWKALYENEKAIIHDTLMPRLRAAENALAAQPAEGSAQVARPDLTDARILQIADRENIDAVTDERRPDNATIISFARAIAAEGATQAGLDDEQTRWLEIGQAVERACEVLPEGCDLHIELEHHAGGVRLYLPDTDASVDDFEADTFGGKINAAIDFAIDGTTQGAQGDGS